MFQFILLKCSLMWQYIKRSIAERKKRREKKNKKVKRLNYFMVVVCQPKIFVTKIWSLFLFSLHLHLYLYLYLYLYYCFFFTFIFIFLLIFILLLLLPFILISYFIFIFTFYLVIVKVYLLFKEFMNWWKLLKTNLSDNVSYVLLYKSPITTLHLERHLVLLFISYQATNLREVCILFCPILQ